MTNALRFPGNGDSPTNSNTTIYFAAPHSNGLPMWGPSNAGVTIIREVKSVTQTGYYARFWYSEGTAAQDGTADIISNLDKYWGMHPYPPGGASGTTHLQEIAVASLDNVTARDGSSTIAPSHGVWKTEGMRVTYNGDNTKTLVFYPLLPSVVNADVIEYTTATSIGASEPPTPYITIGDSPWWAAFQHERGAMDQARIKIIAKVLSQADLLLEAADMTQLVTADAIANIWWGKTDYTSNNDLTCNYGTGRSFSHGDTSNKVTLVAGPVTVTAAAGSSAAVSSVVGAGASRVAVAAIAAGTSTVVGRGASVAAGAVTAAAVATVTAAPNSISAATALSQAVAVLTGSGAATVASTVSAAGAATVLGVSNNGGTISAGAGSISSVATVQGAGASTVSAAISAAGVLDATAVSNGAIVVSAAGSISVSASVNGAGASSVTAVAQSAAVATVKGVSTTPRASVNGGSSRRHAIRAQQLADDDAALLDLAAMLVPLISQGGPLWAH